MSSASSEELNAAAGCRPDALVVRRESGATASLLRALRAHPELSGAAIVLGTSSRAQEEAILEGDLVDAVLSLPCDRDAFDALLSSVVGRRARLGRRRPTAVVVDDSAVVRSLTRKELEHLGFDVSEAADGVEGEALIRSLLPNLAVVDVEMPRLSGLELCERLANDPRTSGLPVLVVSGSVDPALAREGFEMGAIDFLPKPFSAEQLATAVSSLLDREAQRLSCAFVLESSPVQASVISKLLGELGLAPHVASTPEAFENMANVGTPELATVDLSADRNAGLELVRRLRQHERMRDVPIVSLGRMRDRELLVESLRAGASDFLVKPFLREEMSVRITNLLTTRRLREDVNRRTRELERLAYRDALTGLGNRRMFDEALRQELAVATRTGRPLAILALDLDRFKRINDEHGHAAGDEVIRAVGAMIGQSVRQTDVACRYGGEEIFVLAPDCPAPAAEAIAERLRARCASLTVGAARLRPTMSIGVSVYPALSTETRLVADADEALYRAKEGGRNRVCVHVAASPPMDLAPTGT